MKTLFVAIICLLFLDTCYAMRCQGHIIDEGSRVYEIVKYCGTDYIREQDTMIYFKDDGMTYILHLYQDVVTRIDLKRTGV